MSGEKDTLGGLEVYSRKNNKELWIIIGLLVLLLLLVFFLGYWTREIKGFSEVHRIMSDYINSSCVCLLE